MFDIYTTKTAALRASKASIRKLDTKSVTINGKKVNPDEYALLNEENTFSANNIFEGDISIENSSIIFNGDSDVIPENSVTNEAKLAAESAAASAEVCAASEQIVIEKTEIASAAATSAETSATNAAASAELLGDAALQSGNNTFTGKNVFDGAVSGSGTLLGVPFSRWMGLSSILDGLRLTLPELDALFPGWENKAICPMLDCSLWKGAKNVGFGEKGLQYAFFTFEEPLTEWGWQPRLYGELKELWISYYGSAPYLFSISTNGLTTYLLLPNMTSDMVTISAGKWESVPETRIVLYAPKWTYLTVHGSYDVNYSCAETTVAFVCNPAPTKKLVARSPKRLKFENANFSNCTSVNVTEAHFDRGTILTILETLPAYDATTMTTVPTCSFYVNPELEGDEEIVNAFLNLQTSVEEGGKGWTVAVSGIGLTESATFSLRSSLYCKKLQDDSGRYVDSDGNRWDVSSGTIVLRHGIANEQLGYEPFENLESALETWGLMEYVDPRAKEMAEEFNN